jgi:hypothetical protein
VNGRLVKVADMTPAELEAWAALAAGAVEPNPVFEPACLLPASRYLPRGRDITLVVAEDGGQMHGCFPVLEVGLDARPSTSFRGVFRPAYTTQVRRNRYDGTPLLRSEKGVAAARAMLEALAEAGRHPHSRPAGPGLLVLESLRTEGPVWGSLAAAACMLRVPAVVHHSYPRPVANRRSDGNYLSHHSKKSRYNWARAGRQLGERLGGEPALVDCSHDPVAVERLLDMEAAGYKARTTGRRRDASPGESTGRGGATLLHPGEPAWFKEMCDQYRAGGRLVVQALQVLDQIVAMQLSVRAGNGVYLLATVYDEKYSAQSPGAVLAVRAMQEVFGDDRVDFMDTCTYEGNDGLLRLYPDRRQVSCVVLATGGLVDRTALQAYETARRLAGAGSPLRSSHRFARLVDRFSDNLHPKRGASG